MKQTNQLLILCFLFLNCFKLFSQQGPQAKKLDTLNWINKEVHSFHMTKLKILDLDSLKKGYDSLRIRIFVNPSSGKPDRLIELSLTDDIWKGTLVNYNLEYNRKEKLFYAENIKKKKVKPKQGWDLFIRELIESSILTLPDEDLIRDYPVVTDGISFCIEISTVNSYRFYCYSNPEIVRNKIQEAERMDFIIEKMYSELKIK